MAMMEESIKPVSETPGIGFHRVLTYASGRSIIPIRRKGESMFTDEVMRFFHPVMSADALRGEPKRVLIANHPYVLFRDGSGRAAALEDRCPHRFAPLSAGRVRKDGHLECPYHGWHFDAEGRGGSPTQPELSRCDVAALQLVERYGYLWLAARHADPGGFPSME